MELPGTELAAGTLAEQPVEAATATEAKEVMVAKKRIVYAACFCLEMSDCVCEERSD